MFIDKSFINELRASLESHMGEEFVAEPYAGSEVAEELLALDDMENMVVASESYAEAILEGSLGYQELALESAGLSVEEFGKFQAELGTEAIINAVKRGGYNVVIAIKKAISKIVKLIFAVFDFFVLADGRWKSYSKLFKKYREKMIRLKPGMTEKAADKEYTLRNHKAMLTYCQTLKTLYGDTNILGKVKNLTGGLTVQSAVGTITSIVRKMTYVALKSANASEAQMNKAQENITDLKDNFSAKFINDLIDTIQKESEEGTFKEALKDIKTTLKDEFNETHELQASAAVNEMLTTLSDFERVSNKDIKFLKDIKKIQKDIDKAIDKYKPAEKNDQELDNAVIRLFGVLSNAINKSKYIISGSVKLANSNMQAVLSDAAKVIAGETRISD